MSLKRICVTALALSLVVLLAASCKRNEVTEPDPFGPASLQLTFDLSASPNVLYTTNQRQQADITATVKWDGKPAGGQTVYFTIDSGPGEFSNLKDRMVATTDSNGTARVVYLSPTGAEVDRDTYATVKGQVQTSSPYYYVRYVDIRLLRH